MCFYLRAKFEVSSIVLTIFRTEGGVIPPPPPTPQNEPLKSSPRLGLSADLSYTYKCVFQVSVNLNVIPTSFLAFHIPLIFARQQLKISEICPQFQPIKLEIFCILTIMSDIIFSFRVLLKINTKVEVVVSKRAIGSNGLQINIPQEVFLMNYLVLPSLQMAKCMLFIKFA